MKKINLLLFFVVAMYQAYTQQNNFDLPPEFKDVAVQAFQKVSSSTRQWFADAARQHPAGAFDTVWTKKKLRERFTVGEIDGSSGLMIVMMAYQKMINKEAKENRNGTQYDQKMVLKATENKLKTDNIKIDQQNKEADAKANNTLTAAQSGFWIGIVSGIDAKGINNQGQRQQIKSNVRMSPVVIPKTDTSKLKVKNSVPDEQIQKEEQAEEDAEDAGKASEDHKKATKDALQKLLDQLARMKPSL